MECFNPAFVYRVFSSRFTICTSRYRKSAHVFASRHAILILMSIYNITVINFLPEFCTNHSERLPYFTLKSILGSIDIIIILQ